MKAGGGKARSTGRRIAFRVIAVIMSVSGVAFGLFTVASNFFESQRIHNLHNAVVGALLLVITSPATIAAARNPEQSTIPLTHLAAVGVAGLTTMAVSLTFDPFTLPFVLLVGVLWILRLDGDRPIPPGRSSPVLLALALASAVPLVTYALGQAELQRTDSTSEHAELYHWVETSFYAVSVLLLGLLAAVRPAAYRMSAWTAGLALAILGGASVAFSDRASALDTAWAWAALAGGVVFVAGAEVERRRLQAAHSARAG